MNATDQKTILSRPPLNESQVLVWTEDLGLVPTPAEWQAARALPPTTPLRDVLRALGACDASLTP